MSGSCLVEKIGHHVQLSALDEALLARLEESEERHRKHRLVRDQGTLAQRLYVVRSGWFYSYTLRADGGRQILHIHYPGDIVGIPDVAFERVSTALCAATDGVLCPFPKSALDDIFVRSPRLSALLFSIGMVEHAVLADRIRIMGRSRAHHRVAHFLLEVLSRLRVTRRDVGPHFELPLSQSMIGDATGLSNVYVSRALKRLQQESRIERDKRSIRLVDEAALRREVDFTDRHFRIDTSWFPRAG
ncbi:MAG: Crp/Fnr family transcriptional regulator [Xanthomonadales bacterium]|nr:Crp/Fnr family transcriptional regulator [Xanthomonadales bacterium]MCB1641946.1 Crp/Fnr family transcriptional regulator [Xanthomonadales bacterium]